MESVTMQPVGFVRSPFTDTAQIPKGLGAEHTADGLIEIRPELERGLTDIEGFSHLIVVWMFHRAEGYELLGTPPSDDRPHGVFATRSPRRPTRSASRWSSCRAATGRACACAGSICWTARRFWT